MKKLLTILLVLISFSTFAQFEAGEYINSDTVKIDGTPLLLNTFKQGNLGGAGNIFYSTGASSQPASGSLNQVIGGNTLTSGYVPYFNGTNLANTNSYFDGTNWGIGTTAPGAKLDVAGTFRLGELYYSDLQIITLPLGTETWVNLATIPNNGTVRFQIRTSSYDSEEMSEVKVFGTYYVNQTGITVERQTYKAHLLEVRVTGIDGGGKTVYVRMRTSSFNATLNWRVIESKGAVTINNYEASPSGGLALLVNGNLSVNTNVGMNIAGNVGIGTTTPTERLDINGNLIADVLKSRVATGTPPLVVASSTKVDSLNVGFLDGKKASDFQLKSDTLTFDATISDLADSSAAIRALANTKATISGTDNYIMKKTGANTLGNSNLIDYGSYVNSSVQFNAPIFYAGSTVYSAGNVDLGFGRTGDNFAYVDFIGDQTYTDYGFRIIRGNTGANTYTQFLHRGTGDFSIKAQDAGRLILGTKNTAALIVDTLQNVGVGILTPAARIHSQSTTTQLRLGYDATKYADLSTGSTGNLTIDPTGDTVKVVGAVNSTGGFFKNGVEITGGGGGISNIGLQVPTGLTVAPTAITQNDTFVVSLQSGYSIPTTANQTNWTAGYNYRLIAAGATAPLYLSLSGNVLSGNLSSQLKSIGTLTPSTGYLYYNGSSFSYAAGGSMVYPGAGIPVSTGSAWGTSITNNSTNWNTAYNDKINSISITGSSTKTITLTQQDAGTVYNSFEDLGSMWVNSSGVAESTMPTKINPTTSGVALRVRNESSTGMGIYGDAAGSGDGVSGFSTTGFGGAFYGLGCKATKFYVSSLNTAPASSSATGTTGEIRICSTGIYICIATNTWIRQLFSTW